VKRLQGLQGRLWSKKRGQPRPKRTADVRLFRASGLMPPWLLTRGSKSCSLPLKTTPQTIQATPIAVP
jgi:hypothetical protein